MELPWLAERTTAMTNHLPTPQDFKAPLPYHTLRTLDAMSASLEAAITHRRFVAVATEALNQKEL